MKSFKNFINNFRQGSDQDHLEADQHTDTGTFAQGFSGCAVSSQPAAQYLFAQLAAATTAPRALGAGPDPEEWLPRVGQTTTHGFFAVPSSMAYDSLHRVLAIGNQHGQIHLFQGVLPEEAPVFVSSMAEPVRPVSPSMPDTGATAGRPGARPSAAAFYARQAGLADGGSPGSATPPRRPARRAVAPRVSTINLNGRQGVRLLAFTSSELSSHAVTQAQRPGAPRLEYEDGLGGLLVVDQDSNLYLYQREYLTLIQSIKAASFLNPGDSVTFIYPMPRSPLVFIGLNSGGVVVFTVYPTLVQAHFTLPTPFREEVDSPRRSAHSAPFAVVAISMNPADANQLLVAHRNNHAIVWELDKRQPRRAFALPLHATPKASSSGGPAATTTTTTATPVDLFSELRAAVWQPIAGRWLATGHACGLICVFDFHAAAPAVAAAAGSDPQRVVLPPVESPHVIINAMGTPQSSLGQRRQPISSIRWCSVPSLPDLSSPEGTMHAALADAAPPLSPNVATLETVMIIEGGAFPEDDPGFSLLYIGMGQTFSASRYFLLPSAEPSRLGDDAATLAASAPARADDPARLLAVIEAAPRRGAAALGFVSLDPGSGQLAAFLFGSHGCYRPAAINHSWLTLARRQATIVTIARSGVPSAPPPIFGDADSAEPSYHGFSSLANGLVSPALHALLASLSSPGTPAASPGSDLLSIWRYSPLEAYVQPVSPSQLLLTGHSDGTVCFWDISNKGSEGSRIVTLPINHVSFVPTASAALSVAYRAINDLTPGGGPGSTVTSPPMSPSHAATVGAAATAAAQQQQQQQQQRPASTSHAPGAGMLSRAMATLWVSSVEDPRPLRSAYRLFEKLSEPLFNDEGAATSRSLSELSVSFGGTQRSFSRAFVHRILEFTPVSSLSVPGAERLSPPTSPTPVGAAGPGGGAHASPAAGGAQPGPGGPVTPRAPPPVALSGDVAALVFVGSLLVASRPDAVAPQSQFTPDRFLAPVVGPAVPPNSTVSTLPVSILRRFCDDPAPGSPYMPDGRQITVCVSTTHVRVLLGQPVAGGSGLSGGLSLDALLRRTGHFPADADFACLSADALPGRAPGAEKLTFLRADILQVPLVTALAGGTPIPRSRFPSAAEVAAMHAASGAVPAAPATAAEAPPPGGSRPGALACPPLSLESGYCLAVLTSDGGLYLLALPSLHVMYIMPTGPLFVDRAWRLGLAAFLSGPMPSDLGVCLFEGHGQLGFTPLFGDYEEDDHAGVGFGPGGVPAEPHQQHSVFDAARVHFLRGCALSAGDKFGDGVPQLAQTQSLFSNLLSRLHNYGDDDIINLIAPPSSRPASRSPSHGSGLGASGRGQTPAEKRAALLQGSSVPPPSNARQPEDPATVQVSAGAAGAAAAAHRAKLALDERGQRLQDAQLKTEELADESRNFADSSKNLRKLMEKKRFLF
ncbi:hypothetical protein H696_03764 [Fonticula alba]|uniref:V-SNARE coiled-coil homology domain-containing protein n=1 Tax=Fonticula alba TaxID=691883 RepID=A0A058Z726_FONAL|nr:hypothetical protein H696_03764 [Fonticula alba]KCV69332.1 hypothetical protein H696_03764 [Fonticula alba]|eukprot:XP_009495897.1 hypothetical protein H696_03764 [Fonticula alba]